MKIASVAVAAVFLIALPACSQTDADDLAALRVSAAQGDADAQFNLGGMYATGDGVPPDAAEAVRWLRQAADQGHARAQFNLGGMYATGRGVPPDAAEAARWLRQAADQGYAAAQSNLGFRYSNGEGVPQDDAEAVRWYRQAADRTGVSPELLAIIGSAIALASIIVPGQRSIHRDIAELRDRMAQDNTDLRERMARLEDLFKTYLKALHPASAARSVPPQGSWTVV